MKIAIYARVSSEKQEKQETIASQVAALREYAKKQHLDVYQEYIDNGYSGELLDRPALDKLRDDAKKNCFSTVLIHSPDRLSRKYIYQGLVQEELKRSDVNILYLNRPDAKDTPEEHLLNGVQGIIAEYEKAKFMERTRRGKLHKVKNNKLIGNIPPYGYKYAEGTYQVIETEAKIVKLIFSLLIDKQLSVRSIAKKLTARGVPPKKGIHWRTSTLHRILRNETYAGVTYYNKHVRAESKKTPTGYRRMKKTSMHLRPKDQWIPITLPDNLIIISKETFEAAQKQLKKNSDLSPRNVKYNYLLRGLIECGNCGSPFQGIPSHGKLFYRCGNRARTFPLPKECNTSMVKAEVIENAVWNKFCEVIQNPELISDQVDKLRNKAMNSKDSLQSRIDSINNELKLTEKESDRLLDAYREEIITIDQLKVQMEKIQTKQKRLESDKQLLINQLNLSPALMTKTITDYCNLIKSRLNGIKNDFESRRYLLSLAISKIILEGKKARIKSLLPVVTASTTSS